MQEAANKQKRITLKTVAVVVYKKRGFCNCCTNTVKVWLRNAGTADLMDLENN